MLLALLTESSPTTSFGPIASASLGNDNNRRSAAKEAVLWNL